MLCVGVLWDLGGLVGFWCDDGGMCYVLLSMCMLGVISGCV